MQNDITGGQQVVYIVAGTVEVVLIVYNIGSGIKAKKAAYRASELAKMSPEKRAALGITDEQLRSLGILDDVVPPKGAGGAADELGIVKSRVNVANGKTRFTTVRPSTGQPVSAGFDHVVDGHFGRTLSKNRSVFSITQSELKATLQSATTVKSPVKAIPGGQYVRVVNTGKVVGNTALKYGGGKTTWIKVITDKAGNLITTYPVPKP